VSTTEPTRVLTEARDLALTSRYEEAPGRPAGRDPGRGGPARGGWANQGAGPGRDGERGRSGRAVGLRRRAV